MVGQTSVTDMQASTYTLQGHLVEIVYSGAPGWFDFYINGKPWGCAKPEQLKKRIQEVINLKEEKGK
jgi:hypothetical protein